MNREQQMVIEYLQEEIKILKELQVDDGFWIFTIADPDQMMIEVFYSVL